MVVYGYINKIYSIIDILFMDLYYQYLNQIGMWILYDIIRSPIGSHIFSPVPTPNFPPFCAPQERYKVRMPQFYPADSAESPEFWWAFDHKVLDFCWARLWCSNRPWWSVSVSISPSPTAVFGNNSSALKWTSMWAGEVWQNHPPISFPWIFWSSSRVIQIWVHSWLCEIHTWLS